MGKAPDEGTRGIVFSLFNEIGILSQLSAARFSQCLPGDLTLPQFSVLNHLVRLGDGKTPLRLARAFQVPKPTMTHTLSGLLKNKMVVAKVNSDDKRSKLIYLTNKGRRAQEKSIDALVPDLAFVLTVFSADEIEAALPFLQKLRKFLDENR